MILSADWPRIVGPRIVQGLTRWIVDARPKGRKFFTNESDAKNYREFLRRDMLKRGFDGKMAPPEFDAAMAREILSEFGVSLSTAAEAYVKAERERRAQTTVTVAVAAEDWRKSKQAEYDRGELAKATMDEIRLMATDFTNAFPGKHIHQLTAAKIQSWLDSLPYSPRTRANIRTKLGQLLNHCVKREWIAKSPISAVTVKLPPKDEAATLSVKECKTLLDACYASPVASSAVPFVLLGLYAGLRPGEVLGLSWSEIEPHQVRVLAATSKTRQTRYVPISDQLSQALEPHRPKIPGPVICHNWRRIWDAVKAVAGFGPCGQKWDPDVLRHTYASMWLSIQQDRNKLAEVMGNSPEVIRSFYRRAIPPSEAKAYFEMLHFYASRCNN